MGEQTARKTNIVVVGGGFGGVYTLKRLHSFFHGRSDIQLTLVNENNYFLFTPLLHEVATGSIWPENIIEPFRKFFTCCPINYHIGRVESISLEARQVLTSQGALPYDFLVMALGSETNFYDVPGARERTFLLKTLEDAIDLKNHFIHTFEKASHINDARELEKLLHFVVVGGGPTGVELAAEMSDFFYGTFAELFGKELVDKARITILQRGEAILNHFPESLQRQSLKVLRRKKINVRLNTVVSEVGHGYVLVDNNYAIPTETVTWAAGVSPKEVSFDSAVQKDKKGRLLVGDTLELEGFENVFVIGDMAAFTDKKSGEALPALAQVATQEARCAALNIKRKIEGRAPLPFRYKHKGDLVSLGLWIAVGEIGSFKLLGHFTWLLWRAVYFSKLITKRKKLKVAVDWLINAFLPRDTSELYKSREREARHHRS